MAQQGVALGGAAAGALIGTAIPGVGWVLGAQIGFVAGSVIGAALFPQKGPKPQKEDLTIQAASYGTPISILAGCDRTAGTMIWVKGNEIDRRKVEQGGKGFMGGGVTTYQYFASFAVLIGEGPIDGVRRIWADTKLIYNKSGASLDSILASGGQTVTHISGIDGDQRVYLGTETQLPDPAIQADKGADNVSAYRGLAYIVFDELPLADFANRIPNISVEYVKDGTLVYRSFEYSSSPASIGVFNALSVDTYFGPYLYGATNAGDWVVKFDTTTREIVAAVQPGVSLTGAAPVSDEFGNIYVPGGVGVGVCFYRLDAITLQVTGSAPIVSSAGLAHLTYRTFKSGAERYIVGASVSGHVGIYDAAALTEVADVLSAGVGEIVDIDEDGNIYGPWNNSSTSKLKKFAVVETGVGPLYKAVEQTAEFDLTAVHGGSLQMVHYYADEGVVLTFGDGVCAKIDPGDGTVIASVNVGGNYGATGGYEEWRRGPTNGKMWFNGGSNTYKELDVPSMTVTRTLSQALWATGTRSLNCYDPWSDSLFVHLAGGSADLQQNFLPRIDPLDVDRADVITQYSELAGLTASQINVSLVTDTIQGNTIRRQPTARDALEPILQSGFLDAVDVDAKVKFVPRGQSVTLTVTEDDLGAALWGENSDIDKLIQTIPQELNRPERVLIRYSDRENQYDSGAQAAKRSREIINSRDQMTFDTSEVMSKDTAMRLAERLLYSLWAETPVKFSLPPKYRKLIPTDVITITVGSVSYRVRITKIDDGPYLECEGMVEEPATYTSTATGGESNIPEQVLQLLSPTQLFLIDSNLIRDEDDDGGHYLAGAPTVPDGLWPGFVVFKSSDAVSFAQSTSFDVGLEWGVVDGALGSHGCTTFDRDNQIVVQMVSGELSSVTELEALNGSNALLLQSGDDWELICAADVTDLGGGRYQLTTLLRGLRGTEQLASGHAAGDKLIVLSTSTMQRILSDSEIGLERYYKPVTFGALFSPVGAVSFTNTARGRECYAPVHVTGSRDGSNNLTITWTRRTRIGGELDWADGVASVPLGEDSEAYEVVIPDASPPRIISVTAETASYSAASQTTDGFTPGDPIDVIVYQMSATNGRGRPASFTV
jgi:hypothetical protein